MSKTKVLSTVFVLLSIASNKNALSNENTCEVPERYKEYSYRSTSTSESNKDYQQRSADPEAPNKKLTCKGVLKLGDNIKLSEEGGLIAISDFESGESYIFKLPGAKVNFSKFPIVNNIVDFLSPKPKIQPGSEISAQMNRKLDECKKNATDCIVKLFDSKTGLKAFQLIPEGDNSKKLVYQKEKITFKIENSYRCSRDEVGVKLVIRQDDRIILAIDAKSFYTSRLEDCVDNFKIKKIDSPPVSPRRSV